MDITASSVSAPVNLPAFIRVHEGVALAETIARMRAATEEISRRASSMIADRVRNISPGATAIRVSIQGSGTVSTLPVLIAVYEASHLPVASFHPYKDTWRDARASIEQILAAVLEVARPETAGWVRLQNANETELFRTRETFTIMLPNPTQ